MKTAFDCAVFVLGVLILVLVLRYAHSGPQSEIVKMEFREVQPQGTDGT